MTLINNNYYALLGQLLTLVVASTLGNVCELIDCSDEEPLVVLNVDKLSFEGFRIRRLIDIDDSAAKTLILKSGLLV